MIKLFLSSLAQIYTDDNNYCILIILHNVCIIYFWLAWYLYSIHCICCYHLLVPVIVLAVMWYQFVYFLNFKILQQDNLAEFFLPNWYKHTQHLHIYTKKTCNTKKYILTFKIDDMCMLLQTIHLLHGKGRTSVVGWSLLLHCVWHSLQCSYQYLTVTNLKLMLFCIWMNICMVCSSESVFLIFCLLLFVSMVTGKYLAIRDLVMEKGGLGSL